MKFLFDKIASTKTNFWLFTTLFTIVYCLISLVNHYNFNTHALDLGLYTHACYQYAHLNLANIDMIQVQRELMLSDHFDLYLILFSPFIYIFKTYTLLILQIASVIIGAIGVRKIAKENFNIHHLLPVFHYYLFFGLYAALSFEYHSNVIASCILVWFIYYFINKNLKATLILFVFLLISKENFSLFMAFVCLGLGFLHRGNGLLKWGGIFFTLSLIYFISIVQFVMPALSTAGHYKHFDFRVIGNDIPEAIKTIITSPFYTFKYLFFNHTGYTKFDYFKTETHVFLLLSGVGLLLLRPVYLFMLIPVYFQKMLHNDTLMWGPYYQYNIEFLPIIVIGAMDVINTFKNRQNAVYLTLVITTFIVSVRLMDRTINYFNKSQIRIYQPSHYLKKYNKAEIKKEFSEIPIDAVVSAQAPFVPHLCLREHIYCFPITPDADYVVFSFKESPYPQDSVQFKQMTTKLLHDKNFVAIYDKDSTYILRRLPD